MASDGREGHEGRIVPWNSWNEWRGVKELLFSNDPEDVVRGLRVLAVWQLRGRVPLAVEATSSLLEAIRCDKESTNISEHYTRLAYAAAVTRLVNGVTETAQTGKYASSVASLAFKLDLPRFLVDVRHEASHGDLPPLPLLRRAAGSFPLDNPFGPSLSNISPKNVSFLCFWWFAGSALEWLSKAYWEPQERKVEQAQDAAREILMHMCREAEATQSHLKRLEQVVPHDASWAIVKPILKGTWRNPPLFATESAHGLVRCLSECSARWKGLASALIAGACETIRERSGLDAEGVVQLVEMAGDAGDIRGDALEELRSACAAVLGTWQRDYDTAQRLARFLPEGTWHRRFISGICHPNADYSDRQQEDNGSQEAAGSVRRCTPPGISCCC